jgi:TonB-dependent Receptor Plug Domain
MRVAVLSATLIVALPLAVRAQVRTLPEVTVEAERVRGAKLQIFEQRRVMGIGHFLTEADLSKHQNNQLADVLRRLPGAMIARDRGSAYITSSRGTPTIENQPAFQLPDKRVLRKGLCPIGVLLDGVPVYRGTGEPPFDVNQVPTRDLLAVEFYAGPAQVPAELNGTGTACGLLVLWTK